MNIPISRLRWSRSFLVLFFFCSTDRNIDKATRVRKFNFFDVRFIRNIEFYFCKNLTPLQSTFVDMLPLALREFNLKDVWVVKEGNILILFMNRRRIIAWQCYKFVIGKKYSIFHMETRLPDWVQFFPLLSSNSSYLITLFSISLHMCSEKNEKTSTFRDVSFVNWLKCIVNDIWRKLQILLNLFSDFREKGCERKAIVSLHEVLLLPSHSTFIIFHQWRWNIFVMHVVPFQLYLKYWL